MRPQSRFDVASQGVDSLPIAWLSPPPTIGLFEAAADIALSVTAVRPPGTWRCNVEELHPTCRATVEAEIVPDASTALAALIWMGFNAGGRPPMRPRTRLAASVVRVR
jgi:hypothetical protein